MIDTLTSLRLTSNTSQRLIALGVVLAVCYYAQAVVITFFCSVLFAFLLEPPVTWLIRLRFPRPLAAFVVCILAWGAIGVLGGLLYFRGAAFAEEFPHYETSIRDAVDKITQRIQKLESGFTRFMPQERQPRAPIVETRRPPRSKTSQPPPPQPPLVQEVRLKDDSSLLAKYVLPQVRTLTEILLYVSFVPFLVYFMLSWRDHVRHGFVNLFALENRQVVHTTLNRIGGMVRAYLVGNFLLGIILIGTSALIFWYLSIPFAFMMAVISGLLNLIPYVGLPLALVPPMFAAMGANHPLSLFLIVSAIVAAEHLVALNVLYPKLVGSRVHLNPLAVTVAILVWTWMWGGLGLLLAIPITAAIKAVCDNVSPLRTYGELLGD